MVEMQLKSQITSLAANFAVLSPKLTLHKVLFVPSFKALSMKRPLEIGRARNGTNIEEIKELKAFLHDQFKIKDLGRLNYFLGREVIKLKAEEGLLLPDLTYYRKLVGKLNFLTNTRMDIAYSVQHLSQFMQTSREPHFKAALHVLRYLKNDQTLGIFFSSNSDCTVKAFYDSDWAVCPDSRRTVSGCIVLLGDSSISWKSKKQEIVSISYAEAEYRSIRKVVGELVWLKRLLE
ncbi:secreted RxLR effector protein 161-like [Nicotiana tabacum]|uniref:Secreted RxLR effector protein 161-like n=1 Tax=Nicotiana tabacum TaxID=4097 RepID=A0AC58S6D2_TOBAC